jgi:hypothetical protein
MGVLTVSLDHAKPGGSYAPPDNISIPAVGPFMGHSMSSEQNFQHSDPRIKLSICETKTMNSFGDFFKILKR